MKLTPRRIWRLLSLPPMGNAEQAEAAMLQVTIDLEAVMTSMEKALVAAVGKEAREKALAKALTTVAVRARGLVMSQMPRIFNDPVNFTIRSVRFSQATPDNLSASVFISDDATRGLSPRKYLRAEIEGGPRRDKRSEISLKGRALLGGDQQWEPGSGAQLDRFGNVPGPMMVQILSRLGAFGEQGYRANATERTRKRLIKQGVAVTARGFEYFVKRGAGGKPVGVYKITTPAVKATPGERGSSRRAGIVPILVFGKRATYRPRFPLQQIVGDFAKRRFAEELIKALKAGIP